MAGWDIFREMESLRREMDEIFRGFGGRTLEPSFATVLGARSYPRINMREDKDNFYLDTLIPGIEPKDLDMSVLKNTLTISGERRIERAENATWHRRERSTGHFMRTIDIPAEIDPDKVRADYQDGVLTITMPKAEAARPKRIEIKAS